MLGKIQRNFKIILDGFRATDRVTRRRHVLLFMLTYLTLVLVGTNFSSHSNGSQKYVDAFIYATALMAILAGYAFSRYVQARTYGLYVTLPFFIPMPLFSPFGTLGVVTRTANTGVSTRALFDVAFWAPVVSFTLSVIFLVAGTALTEVVAGVAQFENPLILKGIMKALKHIPLGSDLAMHPLLAAGWAGLLFTAINLFPIGALAGGQIAYALFGARQRDIAYVFMASLFVMALYYPLWFAFVLAFIYMGIEHPELRHARNPMYFESAQMSTRQSLDRPRQYLALAAMVIFALSFTLKPFEATGERAGERSPLQLPGPDRFQPTPQPDIPNQPPPASDENSI
ncbi:MAG: site-2 protease family protein [Spirochaetes bacterium]|nr:site-2 protease family protein [Spirochaetota bacterium]